MKVKCRSCHSGHEQYFLGIWMGNTSRENTIKKRNNNSVFNDSPLQINKCF